MVTQSLGQGSLSNDRYVEVTARPVLQKLPILHHKWRTLKVIQNALHNTMHCTSSAFSKTRRFTTRWIRRNTELEVSVWHPLISVVESTFTRLLYLGTILIYIHFKYLYFMQLYTSASLHFRGNYIFLFIYFFYFATFIWKLIVTLQIRILHFKYNFECRTWGVVFLSNTVRLFSILKHIHCIFFIVFFFYLLFLTFCSTCCLFFLFAYYVYCFVPKYQGKFLVSDLILILLLK